MKWILKTAGRDVYNFSFMRQKGEKRGAKVKKKRDMVGKKS